MELSCPFASRYCGVQLLVLSYIPVSYFSFIDISLMLDLTFSLIYFLFLSYLIICTVYSVVDQICISLQAVYLYYCVKLSLSSFQSLLMCLILNLCLFCLKEDIISIWNKTASDQATTARIRDTLRRVLNLPPNTIMEYKTHTDSIK